MRAEGGDDEFKHDLPRCEVKKISAKEIKLATLTVSCMQIGIWSGVDYEIVGQ